VKLTREEHLRRTEELLDKHKNCLGIVFYDFKGIKLTRKILRWHREVDCVVVYLKEGEAEFPKKIYDEQIFSCHCQLG
jgi:hypothetical protein